MADRVIFRAAILCDDVRVENNGKTILIGVYSGDILVSEIPFKLPLQLWLSIAPMPAEASEFIIRTKWAGRILGTATVQTASIQSLVATNLEDVAISLPHFLIKGSEEGDLVIEVQQGDHIQEIARKRVKRALVNPPSISP